MQKNNRKIFFALFLGLQILLLLGKFIFFPEYNNESLTSDLQNPLSLLGFWSYFIVTGTYVLSAFFFIPILILLNIISGALYGPYIGTIISISGITLGSMASTISVRYVFKEIQFSIKKNPNAQEIYLLLSKHGSIMVIIIRLIFIVPYLLQNLILALTPIGLIKLALLTFWGALPGAAAYSLIGAGLVQTNDVNKAGWYIGIGVTILTSCFLLMKYLRKKFQIPPNKL
ncbi:SNARE associated Golgi protein [Desulfocicer vacuolatum DSM 3385]|uniref:TVP38/TMEM64 family membrane protein n=1 Tax=Desulfocicer vacuolatum DSM 3385 TaxID=1121400 RepID=A0A1W2CYR9_9BACT|nr:VTT domain-containing protein [Desulfocicer vacuolatum]SMC90014.1 SNARE associated Golgi protein [Desulfocicer vacuolatum DSM 3385]